MKKIFFLVGFFISFAQIVFASTIFTANQSGSLQTTFYTNQSVYLAPSTTNITTNSTTVRIYIVNNSDSWANGTSLTGVTGGFKTFTTNDTGYLNATYPSNLIWLLPVVGNYDIVADVDGDGIYESNTDFVFNSTGVGFQILPVSGPILTVSIGRNSTSDHTYTIPSNNSDAVMIQLQMTSGISEGVSLESISLIANGTGNDATGISVVKLVNDLNSNGIYDSGETLLTFDKYLADNGTAQLTMPNSYSIPSNSTVYFLIVYMMSNTSSNGDKYSFYIPSISAIGTTSGTNAKINGLYIYSPILTVNSTLTPTTTTTTTISNPSTSSSSSSTTTTTQTNKNYFWIYVAGGISAVVLVIFVILYLRGSHTEAATFGTPPAQPGPQS